jgi:hypothetical protein
MYVSLDEAGKVVLASHTDEVGERRERGRSRGNRRSDMQDFAAERRGTMSDAALAREMADRFGGSVSTYTSGLSRGQYGRKPA